ncbi:SMI1/KNR4 family protein [Rhodopirellula sp. JC639]|uniref:SMI1/KNR4 family protein n=1 Tax=Stieleria mannarensis TaxID=2755585 RepID=UPI001C71AEE4|nr:SMI1/KNR4 family protein [Rhodopirellula sp. JC639]
MPCTEGRESTVLKWLVFRPSSVTATVLPLKMDIESIRDALVRCRLAQPKVFGSDSHEFKLNARVDGSVVTQFEAKHDIKLPEDYRRFVTEIGNGGAGPFYGVFKLGEMDNNFSHKRWKEDDGFIGVLAKPFPHTKAWNDLPTYPEEQDDEDAYEAELEAFDEVYWNSENVDGAIPICHQGCAYRNWLIVTGPEAGNVWEDLRVDHKGLIPVNSNGGHRVRFLEWYTDWLTDAVAGI